MARSGFGHCYVDVCKRRGYPLCIGFCTKSPTRGYCFDACKSGSKLCSVDVCKKRGVTLVNSICTATGTGVVCKRWGYPLCNCPQEGTALMSANKDLSYALLMSARDGASPYIRDFIQSRPLGGTALLGHLWVSVGKSSKSWSVAQRHKSKGRNQSSNQGLRLNRSQCGGCSTEYITLASNQVVCK